MRVKLLKLELLDNPKVKVTADIQLGSLLVIHGIKLLRLDNGRMMVYMPSRPEGSECAGGDRDPVIGSLSQTGTEKNKKRK